MQLVGQCLHSFLLGALGLCVPVLMVLANELAIAAFESLIKVHMLPLECLLVSATAVL